MRSNSTLEAGIVLMGSEVKVLRSGKTTIGESYAQAKDGELFLVNSYIPEYTQASRFNHEPRVRAKCWCTSARPPSSPRRSSARA